MQWPGTLSWSRNLSVAMSDADERGATHPAWKGVGGMLRSIKYLEGDAVDATDGTIGHVRDFYFDDRCWVITDREGPRRAGSVVKPQPSASTASDPSLHTASSLSRSTAR
jgi:hypothetical protein